MLPLCLPKSPGSPGGPCGPGAPGEPFPGGPGKPASPGSPGGPISPNFKDKNNFVCVQKMVVRAQSAELVHVLQYLSLPESLVVLSDPPVREHQAIQCFLSLPGSQ